MAGQAGRGPGRRRGDGAAPLREGCAGGQGLVWPDGGARGLGRPGHAGQIPPKDALAVSTEASEPVSAPRILANWV